MKIINNSGLKDTIYPISSNITHSIIRAKIMAKEIVKYFKSEDIILVGRGSSGIVLCTLVSTFIKSHPKIHIIHKNKEPNHGHSVIWHESKQYVVIDDFVCSGYTLRQIEIYLKRNNILSAMLCVNGHTYSKTINTKFYTTILSGKHKEST